MEVTAAMQAVFIRKKFKDSIIIIIIVISFSVIMSEKIIITQKSNMNKIKLKNKNFILKSMSLLQVLQPSKLNFTFIKI
jgi:hypothetical protein